MGIVTQEEQAKRSAAGSRIFNVLLWTVVLTIPVFSFLFIPLYLLVMAIRIFKVSDSRLADFGILVGGTVVWGLAIYLTLPYRGIFHESNGAEFGATLVRGILAWGWVWFLDSRVGSPFARK